MPKTPGPTPLELAFQGDEDALEQVLGGVVAPLFDLALHLRRQPVLAELATVDALRAVAEAVRAGALPHADPLTVAARHLLDACARAPAEPRPPARGPIEAALEALPPSERAAVLAACAADLDGADLGFVLGLPPARGDALVLVALRKLQRSAAELRSALDVAAAEVRLPAGMVDRALGSA